MDNQPQVGNEDTITDFHPYFSVIITTYNRAHSIERAIISLISQTEKDWEGIVIDDGSTDDTYDRISPILRSNPNLKYRKITHGGESAAKNEGIALSRGQFVTFLDSDDEYESNHLKSRKALLNSNPGINFLHGGAEILGNPYVPDRFDPSVKIHLSDCVIGGTFFIERSILNSLKGFKPILLGPDADLFDRAEKAGVEIMKTDLPTYIYHHYTEDSITNTYEANIEAQKNV